MFCTIYLKTDGVFSGITDPILGLFVLIWMHFYPESMYVNENFKFEYLKKSDVEVECWIFSNFAM